LTQIIAPKEGSTVVVSAASGAVGSVVGQLAKVHGCRAVGIAGGPDKCAYVTDTLGFDACVDYKAHADDKAFGAALKAACPDGVDGYFDNVGGRILDAVMVRMNAFGRIAMCGVISTFDGPPVPMAYPQLILVSRLLVQGFIVSEHMQLWPQAQRELAGLVADRRLKYRESIAEGIDAAPAAFLGMLKGRNFGKQLVRLA
jgi:NADPH-dependent curcumin reductase CurA